MCYIAKHYVEISGFGQRQRNPALATLDDCKKSPALVGQCPTSKRKYTPGEIIDTPIPEEKLRRLLRLGAIAPLPYAAPDSVSHDTTGDNDGNGPGGEPCANPAHEEHGEDETFEEAEAPEIDVMDGIVSHAEKTAEETPAKEPEKKTAGKGREKA